MRHTVHSYSAAYCSETEYESMGQIFVFSSGVDPWSDGDSPPKKNEDEGTPISKSPPSHYLTSQLGQLSLAITPSVRTMSIGDI